MPTKAFSQAKLLGTDNTISVASLSADIPITEKLATVDDLPSTGVIGEQAFVEETNRLYIWNGTGWYNIALINTTPTWDSGGQPAGAYELSADSPQTAITITLAASDPEGLSINYSYVTSGSMDSMSTISQDSSVFTITPKTLAQMGGAGNEGPHTGSITFRATDGVNVLPQVSSFTLNFISTIENSKHTIMHVNAIAASDNNNITDSSTNNLTTTVNGNTSAGTFSPYRSGGYATSFSRSASSNLEIASMPAIGSGDCSIEVWCKIDSIVWNGIISRGAYNSSGTFSLSSRSGDTELTLIWSGTIYTTSGANINVGEWKWVQVIRSSGTVTIYVNGSSVGSWSNSANVSSTSNYIIGRVDSSDYFGGDLRDLRISTNAQSSSNGSEKLATDSNTTFLSCHLPYLSYATSSVASNIYSSISGTIETVSNSPYDYLEYSATDHGGSVYFDTSDDYLTVPNGSWKTYGSSNFTIECWFYADRDGMLWGDSSTSGFGDNCTVIAELKNFSGANAWVQVEFRVGSTKYGINPAQGTFKRNAWNHIAFVRNGNTFTVYSNGKDVGNTSQSGSMNTSSNNWAIASGWPSSTGTQFNGYISDFRVSKSARYTAEFTPPIAPLSSTNAELHIKGTDASIVDKAQGTHIECVGSAAGTSSPAKFPGTYSLSLPGFGHWMPSPMESVKLSGTEDWTVEAWVYPTQRQSYSVVVSCGSSFALALGMVSGNFHVYNNSAGGFTDTDVNHGTYDIAANQWTHLAATRVNGNWYCYVDGTLRYQKTGGSWQSHVMNETSQYTIGALDGYSSFSGNERWYGNVQDVRITKGLARYTSNFTAPTAPLEG